MFEIKCGENGVVVLAGRLDAAQAEKARDFFASIDRSIVVDMKELDYISSAGLGVLLAVQKRLKATEKGLTLINLNQRIRNIFTVAGFDRIFEID